MALEDFSDQLNKSLGVSAASSPKLFAECETLCKNFDISPEDLKYKWEAATFSASAFSSSKLETFDFDALAAVKAALQKELNLKKKKPTKKPAGFGGAAVNRTKMPAFMSRNMSNTPMKAGGSAQVKVEGGLGMMDLSSVAGPSKVTFQGPENDASSRRQRNYRYMYEKVLERSEVLDERIDEFADLIRERYNISDFGDPSSSTDEEITIVGRITQDSDNAEFAAKLTEASLTIESSRYHGSGVRVPLRFESSLRIRGGAQGSAGLGFFPGAIVALNGKNGGGGWFSVTEILSMPPPPTSKPDPGRGDSPFSMCVACGPFTSDADLDYKPWRTLLQSLKTTQPAVVLLIGPFVDASHPMLKAGDVDDTPLGIFHARFTNPLRTFLDSAPGSIAILVPSVRDLTSFHAVYPQGEFGTDASLGDSRIHLVPNPARFSINGVKFATTSVDVVYHLRKEELLKRGEEVDSIPAASPEDTGTDSLGNLCRHLLQQRSFYPLFPVPQDVSHEVNLDITHSKALNLDGFAPDVLIVPSRLKQFSKTIHTTTALNPSFLSKGTYATVNLTSSAADSVRERLTTEVVKLES